MTVFDTNYIVATHEHCKDCDAPCMDVCPTDAPMRLDDGRVFIQPDECTMTGGCAAICPFDSIIRTTRM